MNNYNNPSCVSTLAKTREIVYTERKKEDRIMQKSSVARVYRGGVSTSKVLQGFEPISHCGRYLIHIVCEILKSSHCTFMDCFAIARNDAKRYAQGKSVILVYVT